MIKCKVSQAGKNVSGGIFACLESYQLLIEHENVDIVQSDIVPSACFVELC